ncbi:MAG: class I SAM-dependent methyltransferase [Coriobacteriales bacterium]|jgi:O-methyltransferase involved in polyketide biosynthesis|nr:class I SAM-dependent methyltransferase [Coriobacteriales bacterium]
MGTLQGVADTLFIPLEARIFVSKKFPEYFYDAKALSLEEYIPDNSIQKKSSEYAMLASVARYYHMDMITRAFIAQHERCNIVYLGAGLETAYDRLSASGALSGALSNAPSDALSGALSGALSNAPSDAPSGALFYEVDLPDVIAVRRLVLGERPHETLIGGDLFNLTWACPVDAAIPTLILASGVFQYFTKDKVIGFIDDLRATFQKAELLFDATNETGIKYANRYVRKTGNTNALMYFYVNDAAEFANSTNTIILEERVFFMDARRILSKKLGLYTRIAMKIVDDRKRAILIHLAIN